MIVDKYVRVFWLGYGLDESARGFVLNLADGDKRSWLKLLIR